MRLNTLFITSRCPDGTMQDWEDEPEYLISIEDPELRQFALEIHELWKKLCHVVKPEVYQLFCENVSVPHFVPYKIPLIQ